MIRYIIYSNEGLPVERNGIVYAFQTREDAEDSMDTFLSAVFQKPMVLGKAVKDGYRVKKVRFILEELG